MIGVVAMLTAALAVALAVPGLGSLAVEDGVALPLAGPSTSLALAFAFGVMAAVHAGATRHRSGRLLSWTGLALVGVGVAYAIEVSGGDMAHPAAWLMTSAAVAVGLYGASVELQRKHAAEQRDARDAVAVASLATSRARAVQDIRQEHRHEARTALLGIEAAAQCLSQYRPLLSADEQRELSSGSVAEVQRLRSLVEDTAQRSTSFDLREAIMPVLMALGRAGRRTEVPFGPALAIGAFLVLLAAPAAGATPLL